jgi:hypothetical protein
LEYAQRICCWCDTIFQENDFPVVSHKMYLWTCDWAIYYPSIFTIVWIITRLLKLIGLYDISNVWTTVHQRILFIRIITLYVPFYVSLHLQNLFGTLLVIYSYSLANSISFVTLPYTKLALIRKFVAKRPYYKQYKYLTIYCHSFLI